MQSVSYVTQLERTSLKDVVGAERAAKADLSSFSLVVVYMVNSNNASAHFHSIQIVNRKIGATLILIGKECKAPRVSSVLVPGFA